MEKDYSLEQQDKEALRAYVKMHNARTEGREILPKSFLRNESALLKQALTQDEAGQFQRIESRPRRMGLGIMAQIEQLKPNVNIFKTTDGRFIGGIDPFSKQEESSEPETLEELTSQLNFNLVADIISIEKR